jgi:hypothetical protein
VHGYYNLSVSILVIYASLIVVMLCISPKLSFSVFTCLSRLTICSIQITFELGRSLSLSVSLSLSLHCKQPSSLSLSSRLSNQGASSFFSLPFSSSVLQLASIVSLLACAPLFLLLTILPGWCVSITVCIRRVCHLY